MVFWFVRLQRFGLLGDWFLCMGYIHLWQMLRTLFQVKYEGGLKNKKCKIIVSFHFLFCKACEIRKF